jgi:hypothetical protein
LAINGVQLKRVLLTTGGKQYGVHLGPVKCPMVETDPWIEGPSRRPNFYYVQQRILFQDAKERGYDWVVTYPNDVIGVARGNFMNLSTSLAVYAAVNKVRFSSFWDKRGLGVLFLKLYESKET